VRELTYANSYGTDNAGGERNPSPGTPTSLFCNPGGGEESPPPDLHPSIPQGNQNEFQTMGDVFPS